MSGHRAGLGHRRRVHRLARVLRQPRGHRDRWYAECAAVVVRARARRGRTASGAAQGALARRGVALAARRGHRGGGSGRPPLGHVRKYGDVGRRYQHPGLPGGRLPSTPRAVGTGGTRRAVKLRTPRLPGSLGRQFGLVWGGQTVSNVGERITIFVVPTVMIFVLHASALEVGVVAMAQYLGIPLLGPVAGVLVDRWD